MVTPPEVVPGENSDVVKQLQDVLIRLNLIKDTPSNHDGVYGAATQKIVKAFQTSHGLAADGKVGPKTWKALLGLDPVSQGTWRRLGYTPRRPQGPQIANVMPGWPGC